VAFTVVGVLPLLIAVAVAYWFVKTQPAAEGKCEL
jgi:hypothetical protein